LLRDTSGTRVQLLPDSKSFLDNEDNVEVFRQSLKAQCCHKNIEFYLAKLKADKAGEGLAKFDATQIFNDYSVRKLDNQSTLIMLAHRM